MEQFYMAVAVLRFSVFLLFLLAAAGQDLKTKWVPVRIFLAGGAAALVLQGLGLAVAGQVTAFNVSGQNSGGSMPWNVWETCGMYLTGMLPGAVLLLTARFTGSVGAGDGCFFLISGSLLGLRDNLFLLCMTVLFCGLSGLCFYVYGMMTGNRVSGKKELPLLPFAVVPGVWITAVRLVQVVTVGTGAFG